MQDEKYWDKRSLDCNFSIPFNPQILKKQGIPLNAKILDAGCSNGRILRCLAENGFSDLHGVDYSMGMISRAKAECPGANFFKASVTEIPFADDEFDLIINLGLVNHLVEDLELVCCLKEFARVLKPGGLCLITDYSYGTSEFDVQRYLEFLPRYGYYGMIEMDGRKFHHRSHEMLVSMAAMDFDFIEVVHLPFPTKRGHKRECYQLILRKKTKLD